MKIFPARFSLENFKTFSKFVISFLFCFVLKMSIENQKPYFFSISSSGNGHGQDPHVLQARLRQPGLRGGLLPRDGPVRPVRGVRLPRDPPAAQVQPGKVPRRLRRRLRDGVHHRRAGARQGVPRPGQRDDAVEQGSGGPVEHCLLRHDFAGAQFGVGFEGLEGELTLFSRSTRDENEVLSEDEVFSYQQSFSSK